MYNIFTIDRHDNHDFHFFTDIHVHIRIYIYYKFHMCMNLDLLLRCTTFMEWYHVTSRLGFSIVYEYFRLLVQSQVFVIYVQ